MIKPMNKHTKILIAAAVFLCIAGMAVLLRNIFKEEEMPKTELSAWIAEWQWEAGIEDLKKIGVALSRIQVFAAYFDNTGGLYITDDALQILHHVDSEWKNLGYGAVEMTLVNDRFNQDGSVVQKDSGIISKLVSSPESRTEHIGEILDVVDRYNLSGVEIDYEKIEDDDWPNVCAFYSELYEKLHKRGKNLRIVLEPKAAMRAIMLPKGPTYVMMAYNLYGTHSGPGPKADPDFIAKLAAEFAKVPGNNYIAIAAGGFDWSEIGEIAAVTEKQAADLANQYHAVPKRDKDSGSLYFHYFDENNIEHTVWYGDEITLSLWIDAARRAGYHRIALWRLGGLGDATVDFLRHSRFRTEL